MPGLKPVAQLNNSYKQVMFMDTGEKICLLGAVYDIETLSATLPNLAVINSNLKSAGNTTIPFLGCGVASNAMCGNLNMSSVFLMDEFFSGKFTMAYPEDDGVVVIPFGFTHKLLKVSSDLLKTVGTSSSNYGNNYSKGGAFVRVSDGYVTCVAFNYSISF